MKKSLFILSLSVLLLVSLFVGSSIFGGSTESTKATSSNLSMPNPWNENEIPVGDFGRGCCSSHGGQCGCSMGRVVCCDGSMSPSCRC